MHILLIFENVPETSDLYLIPDAPPWVLLAHGLYINADDCPDEGEAREAIDRLSDAICEKLEHCGNKEDPLATAWAKYKVDKAKPLKIIDAVVVVTCGFLM